MTLDDDFFHIFVPMGISKNRQDAFQNFGVTWIWNRLFERLSKDAQYPSIGPNFESVNTATVGPFKYFVVKDQWFGDIILSAYFDKFSHGWSYLYVFFNCYFCPPVCFSNIFVGQLWYSFSLTDITDITDLLQIYCVWVKNVRYVLYDLYFIFVFVISFL